MHVDKCVILYMEVCLCMYMNACMYNHIHVYRLIKSVIKSKNLPRIIRLACDRHGIVIHVHLMLMLALQYYTTICS